MAILGYNTKGGVSRAATSGRKLASKFTLASAGTMTELHGWFNQAGTNGIILVIYADTAGVPGTRVAYTSPLALGAGGTDIELSQTGFSVALAAGDYWLGWVASSSSLGAGWCETSGGTSYEVAGATYNPPSDPYGGGGTAGTRKVSVWAVYTAGGGAPAFIPQIIIS